MRNKIIEVIKLYYPIATLFVISGWFWHSDELVGALDDIYHYIGLSVIFITAYVGSGLLMDKWDKLLDNLKK